MTLHEVTNCSTNSKDWNKMILESVMRGEPKTPEDAVRQAVNATILSLHIRECVRKDAIEVIRSIAYEKDI